MNERDKELMAEAEAYADYNFKGEVYWREAYESRLIDLIRADEREVHSMRWDEWIAKAVEAEREACAKMVEDLNDIGHSYGLENRIRARGNT